jgi:hypothetical protein
MRRTIIAHRSRLGAAVVCVSAACGELLDQRHSADLPCGSSCRATRDASDRLLPSHVLRTSTRASSALDASNACAFARSRRSPVSRSGRFASVGRTFLLPESRRGGRCLPAVTRANRTSDAPVASLTMATPLARMRHPEGRQDHPPRTRVNEVRCRSDPGCLPSSKDPRPATPSRAPGLGLRPRGGLAAATLTIDAFSPPPTLSSRREPGPRPRAPLPAGGALL